MIFLITGFALFILADALLSAAVIYHLRQFTLPGWTLGRTVIALYLIFAGIFLATAAYYVFQINPDDLVTLIRGGLTFPGGTLR